MSVTRPIPPTASLVPRAFVVLGLAVLVASSPAHAQDTTRTAPGSGLGASKVYSASGVSIGGYGEMLYENFDRTREDDALSGALDRIDFLRAVIYAGYKFDDQLLINSEIEIEHGGVLDEGKTEVDPTTGVGQTELTGESHLEFAYLDWMPSRQFGVRAGMLLVPVGLLNETHEPTTFIGARRPDLEQFVVPSTWSANGAGVHGELGDVQWRAYVLEGLDGSKFSTSEGIREGRQGGMQAVANRPAFAARADWQRPGLLIGGSIYGGGAWQTPAPTGVDLDPTVRLLDAHARLQWRGLEAHGLVSSVTLSDASDLSDVIGLTGSERLGKREFGYMVAARYDVLSELMPGSRYQVAPYVRFERYDTQDDVPGGTEDPANQRQVVTAGAELRPHPSVVLKAEREQRSNDADTETSRWNVALGYVF